MWHAPLPRYILVFSDKLYTQCLAAVGGGSGVIAHFFVGFRGHDIFVIGFRGHHGGYIGWGPPTSTPRSGKLFFKFVWGAGNLHAGFSLYLEASLFFVVEHKFVLTSKNASE